MVHTQLPVPMLALSINNLPKLGFLDANGLGTIWTIFAKCGDTIEDGRRLENLSWRLWQREIIGPANSPPPSRSSSSTFVQGSSTSAATWTDAEDDSDWSSESDTDEEVETAHPWAPPPPQKASPCPAARPPQHHHTAHTQPSQPPPPNALVPTSSHRSRRPSLPKQSIATIINTILPMNIEKEKQNSRRTKSLELANRQAQVDLQREAALAESGPSSNEGSKGKARLGSSAPEQTSKATLPPPSLLTGPSTSKLSHPPAELRNEPSARTARDKAEIPPPSLNTPSVSRPTTSKNLPSSLFRTPAVLSPAAPTVAIASTSIAAPSKSDRPSPLHPASPSSTAVGSSNGPTPPPNAPPIQPPPRNPQTHRRTASGRAGPAGLRAHLSGHQRHASAIQLSRNQSTSKLTHGGAGGHRSTDAVSALPGAKAGPSTLAQGGARTSAPPKVMDLVPPQLEDDHFKLGLWPAVKQVAPPLKLVPLKTVKGFELPSKTEPSVASTPEQPSAFARTGAPIPTRRTVPTSPLATSHVPPSTSAVGPQPLPGPSASAAPIKVANVVKNATGDKKDTKDGKSKMFYLSSPSSDESKDGRDAIGQTMDSRPKTTLGSSPSTKEPERLPSTRSTASTSKAPPNPPPPRPTVAPNQQRSRIRSGFGGGLAPLTTLAPAKAAPAPVRAQPKRIPSPPPPASDDEYEEEEYDDDDDSSEWSSEEDEPPVETKEMTRRREWEAHEEDKKTWFTRKPMSTADLEALTRRPSALTALFHPSQVDQHTQLLSQERRNKSTLELLRSKSGTAVDSMAKSSIDPTKAYPASENGKVNPAKTAPSRPPNRLGGPPPGVEMEDSSDDEDSAGQNLTRTDDLGSGKEDDAVSGQLSTSQTEKALARLAQHDREQLEASMAPPLSPRTTRRNMLSNELTESLRRNLIWERQARSRQGGAWAFGGGNKWTPAIKAPLFAKQPESPPASTVSTPTAPAPTEKNSRGNPATAEKVQSHSEDVNDTLGSNPDSAVASPTAPTRRPGLPRRKTAPAVDELVQRAQKDMLLKRTASGVGLGFGAGVTALLGGRRDAEFTLDDEDKVRDESEGEDEDDSGPTPWYENWSNF